MNQLLRKVLTSDAERKQNFAVGDTVKVHYKIVESGKERVQIYEGVVISIANEANGRTFTVRRVSYDIGVERIFPLFSPRIAKIELVRKGKVRRAKLYYLRNLSGKAARIKELKGGKALVSEDRKRQQENSATETTAKSKAE
ncbi:ribosomal protein L19 [Leptospira weilii str. 2006001853]|uniref:Large ribosomal subunit protein bL19 n=3 Tax=Leptospira weilii TaxID=28184 RepID=A0A828Z9W8_9LEPT|nr:50S ribosomal protein L19 [Leptospira weilii]EMM73129.1 ribosomal protein L19 [Leptospira weilii str. 2006001855]EKR66407.1 ribosomal protein L19 [Leptospira weilii str. 2006001853]EMN45361.1 ribosomal protein L19 [Leptospira weilii str. LNT 1234]EMN90483.1 ribosomal protein L19 [Leptospira weilii str. UI 13098]MDL5245222.1 50S ribosomal protein L19 [Leptospira weilii]